MHGIVFPKAAQERPGGAAGLAQRLRDAVLANPYFFLIVILPTMLVGLYYVLFAADQYESSANFVVRRAAENTSSVELGQVLGFSLGSNATTSDAFAVQTYLLSHDAVARLSASNDLVGAFHRPESDWISRLHYSDPERLLKYYRRQVNLSAEEETGITRLTVRTFRPSDSYALARALLKLGEEQINQINQRTYNDQVSNARRELDGAQRRFIDVEARLTAYRRGHEDINPADTGKAQINLVSTLTSNLVLAKARLRAMEGAVSRTSPQYQTMARQVAAMEGQVAAQSSKIAGPDHSIANRLSDYERLEVEREQVAKVYAASAVQFEQAKAEAKRKQLYLIRVVEPNRPVRSEYPKRGEMALTVFASLFFAYGIGWLLWVGFKEHTM